MHLAETDPWFLLSPMVRRARTWPEGYPGDYRTLEVESVIKRADLAFFEDSNDTRPGHPNRS